MKQIIFFILVFKLFVAVFLSNLIAQELSEEIKQAAQRQIKQIAKYSSLTEGSIDLYLAKLGFPPKNFNMPAGWESFPDLRKIETAYLAAKNANGLDGINCDEVLLSRLIESLSKNFESVSNDPILMDLVKRHCDNKISLKYANFLQNKQNKLPPDNIKTIISKITMYVDPLELPSILKGDFGLEEQKAYEIQRESNTAFDAIMKGGTLAGVPPSLSKRLERIIERHKEKFESLKKEFNAKIDIFVLEQKVSPGVGKETSGSTGKPGIGEETSGSTDKTGSGKAGSGEETSGSTGKTGSGKTGSGEETSGSTGKPGIGGETSGSTDKTGSGKAGSGEETSGSTGKTGSGEETSGSTDKTGSGEKIEAPQKKPIENTSTEKPKESTPPPENTRRENIDKMPFEKLPGGIVIGLLTKPKENYFSDSKPSIKREGQNIFLYAGEKKYLLPKIDIEDLKICFEFVNDSIKDASDSVIGIDGNRKVYLAPSLVDTTVGQEMINADLAPFNCIRLSNLFLIRKSLLLDQNIEFSLSENEVIFDALFELRFLRPESENKDSLAQIVTTFVFKSKKSQSTEFIKCLTTEEAKKNFDFSTFEMEILTERLVPFSNYLSWIGFIRWCIYEKVSGLNEICNDVVVDKNIKTLTHAVSSEMINLALKYEESGNYKLAIIWYENAIMDAIERNDVDTFALAICYKGELYEKGKGVQKHFLKAFENYLLAHNLGNKWAKEKINYLLINKETKKQVITALKIIKKGWSKIGNEKLKQFASELLKQIEEQK